MQLRWATARPFLVMSLGAVVVGGLVAAVTGPLELANGSWLAAYLVLVVGVAQLAFGVGRAWLPEDPASTARWVPAELAGWNVGSLGVMAGTLLDSPPLVVAGSLGLLVALAGWLGAVRRTRPGLHAWAWAFRLLVLLLLVSVAVGIALSVARAG